MYRQKEVQELAEEFTKALDGHNSIAIYIALHLTMKSFLNTTPPAAVKADDTAGIVKALARSFQAHSRENEIPAEDREHLEKLGDEYARHMMMWKTHKDLMEFASKITE